MTKCPGCIENDERVALGYRPKSHKCLKSDLELLLEEFLAVLIMIPLIVVMIPVALAFEIYNLFSKKDGK